MLFESSKKYKYIPIETSVTFDWSDSKLGVRVASRGDWLHKILSNDLFEKIGLKERT